MNFGGKIPAAVMGLYRFLFFSLASVYLFLLPLNSLLSFPVELFEPSFFLKLFYLTRLPDGEVFKYICFAWKVFMIFSAIGFITKISLFFSFAFGLYIFSVFDSFSCGNHFANLTLIANGILLFAKTDQGFSVDSYIKKYFRKKLDFNLYVYAWPVMFIRFQWCWMFFSAGLSKLSHHGTSYITENAALSSLVLSQEWAEAPIPLNLFLQQQPYLTQILGFIVILLELTAPLALIFKRIRPISIICLLMMQCVVYYSMRIDLIFYLLCIYIFWIPTSALILVLRKTKHS